MNSSSAEQTRRTGRARAFLRRWPTPIAALLCLVSLTALYVAQRAAHVTMLDLDVYRAEGMAIRTGADLYDMRATTHALPATYPPFAALLFIPLTWLNLDAARILVNIANLSLLVALVHLSLRLLGRRPSPAPTSTSARWPSPVRIPLPALTFAVAALAVWCEPVWTTLRYGQVNLLLAVLVLWDLTRRVDHRWAGIGIGIAAGIKLTPALFAVMVAVAGLAIGARRLRQGLPVWNAYLRRAAVAAATFAGTAGLTALLAPHDSRRFWTGIIFASDRAGNTEATANQSLRGVLARALHTGDPGVRWLIPALVIGCAGLALATAALLAVDRLPHATAWAAVSCGVTALVVSPISWSHHWVWAVPLVILLAAEAVRRGARRWAAGAVAAGVLFQSFALWLVPHDDGHHELRQSGSQMLLSAVYPLAGALFLAVAATVTVRAWRRRPPVRIPARRSPGVPATVARPRTPESAVGTSRSS
jgi:hypothetical protein